MTSNRISFRTLVLLSILTFSFITSFKVDCDATVSTRCATCDSANTKTCLTCKAGYGLSGTDCVTCTDTNCGDCLAESDTCSICKLDYSLENKVCVNSAKLEPIAKPAPTLQVSVILVLMPFSMIQLPRNALLAPLVAKPVLPLQLPLVLPALMVISRMPQTILALHALMVAPPVLLPTLALNAMTFIC